MNYNIIYHPILNQYISTKSNLGKKLLKNYLKSFNRLLIGGTDPAVRNEYRRGEAIPVGGIMGTIIGAAGTSPQVTVPAFGAAMLSGTAIGLIAGIAYSYLNYLLTMRRINHMLKIESITQSSDQLQNNRAWKPHINSQLKFYWLGWGNHSEKLQDNPHIVYLCPRGVTFPCPGNSFTGFIGYGLLKPTTTLNKLKDGDDKQTNYFNEPSDETKKNNWNKWMDDNFLTHHECLKLLATPSDNGKANFKVIRRDPSNKKKWLLIVSHPEDVAFADVTIQVDYTDWEKYQRIRNEILNILVTSYLDKKQKADMFHPLKKGEQHARRMARLRSVKNEPKLLLEIISKIYPNILLAAKHGHIPVVELFLADDRVDPNISDENGFTALMFAAKSGRVSMMKLLLANQRVDPNIVNEDGQTALSEAARFSSISTLKLLLADDRTIRTRPTDGGEYYDAALAWLNRQGTDAEAAPEE